MSLADQKILGLTLHAPHGELVAMGLKTIENRGWAPPPWMLGRYIAVHQSTRWDQEGADYYRRNHPRYLVDPPMLQECKFGIIAVARVVGWVQRAELGERPRTVAMLPGFAFGDQVDALGHSVDWRWFSGAEYGWVLRDVKRIEPVAARGLQKLWQLPRPTYESVRRRWAKAA